MSVQIDAAYEFNNLGAEANPATFSVTVGDHPNRALFVWAWAGNEPIITSWTPTTFNSNAMTIHYTQAEQSTLRGYRCWRLVGSDVTVGTHTLSIGLGAMSPTISVHVISLYNVDPLAPTGTIYVDEDPVGGTSSDVTVAVNTTDGLVLSFTVVGGSVTNFLPTSPLTLHNIIGTSGTGTYQAGIASRVGTGSSLVCQWTWTEAQNITAMAFNVNAMGSLHVGHISEPVIGGSTF